MLYAHQLLLLVDEIQCRFGGGEKDRRDIFENACTVGGWFSYYRNSKVAHLSLAQTSIDSLSVGQEVAEMFDKAVAGIFQSINKRLSSLAVTSLLSEARNVVSTSRCLYGCVADILHVYGALRRRQLVFFCRYHRHLQIRHTPTAR
jgi:hypothetical protein